MPDATISACAGVVSGAMSSGGAAAAEGPPSAASSGGHTALPPSTLRAGAGVGWGGEPIGGAGGQPIIRSTILLTGTQSRLTSSPCPRARS